LFQLQRKLNFNIAIRSGSKIVIETCGTKSNAVENEELNLLFF